MSLAIELLLIVALILLNGVLAMSELAVVSARKARLEAMVRKKGRSWRGARLALTLATEPGRFLSAVQIGITLVGIFAGAYSGATLAERLTGWMMLTFSFERTLAEPISFAIVVSIVTYLSLIIGELVPKQLALKNAEGIASAMAPVLNLLAKIAGPLVWLLDISSQAVLRLLGAGSGNADAVTEEEIHHLVAEAESAGTVEPAERLMIAAVLRLGDRPVRSVMTPRHDLDWLDLSLPHEEQLMRLRETTHLLLPAARGSIDEPLGSVSVKDVLNLLLDSGRDGLAQAGIASFVRPVPALHESADLLEALSLLQKSPAGMAFVVDEFGSLEGVVTANDILESIAGNFALPDGEDVPGAVQREDGSWLLDGLLARDAFAAQLGITLPAQEDDYHTVAGFMLARFGRLPETGDYVEWNGWRFEVIDMDGRRIDKVLAQQVTITDGAHDS
ncbi:HlyC/CorC family transporter [Ferrovibrio terrae]|uniref:HlyC/CorC family transporter n=1 Tax=Ferrovibrio terrae TaxID=2594003 RepID=A0A516GZW2_9PROT|nr:hemolysin family protein [Ferrovibrio terrae]QDO97068.1 HlyC/CorC family transporter [Ferrovibrio terrae]